VEIETNVRYWSNLTSWETTGKLPEEGEEVEIEPGWNMVLDIDTPVLAKLTINGRLSFLNDPEDPKDLTLNAKLIYVRAGEFFIGNETLPYHGNA
jgi:hypothetical protein